MTCTMRNWEYSNQSRRTSFASRNRLHPPFSMVREDHQQVIHSPELLLTPIIEYITNRDDSPVRSRHRISSIKVGPENNQCTPYSIAIADIIVVNTSSSSLIQITTLSSGFFEFKFLSANGHDILKAFLQASLDPERIVDDSDNNSDNHHHDPVKTSGSSVTSCLDIDALQARHLRGRAAAETWPEKISRRIGHICQNLSEMSSTLCDKACCPMEEGAIVEGNTIQCHELEIDDNTTDCSFKNLQQRETTECNRPDLQHLPSGLSVEPESENTSTDCEKA